MTTAEREQMTYKVTVQAEGKPARTYEVEAPREGLAKTRSMVLYTKEFPLRGEFVNYEVASA